MKKKILLCLFSIVILITLYIRFNIDSNLVSADQTRKQHAEFLKNHPFSKTMYLSKKERKLLGLPPNAYFEQEYLNEINPTTGRTHPENIVEVQKMLNQKQSKRVPGDEPNNPWVERGPNNRGGRVRAVLFDPNDASHKRVFAGGVSGGLWVNNDITDANSSWQQVGISDNLPVTCIAVDPNNSQIMYLGTGESYTSDNGMGNGVWKSTNGGVTWVNVFSDDSSNIGDRLFYINDIIAWNNPNTNKTEVFIGVGGAYYRSSQQFLGSNKIGLYKTVNDGASWTKLEMNTTEGSPYEPNDLEIGADNTIWLGTERNSFGDGGGAILKSTDGTNFTLAHTLDEGRRTEISVSKTDKDKIFVLASGTNEPIIMVKTDNGFSTTTTMTLPNDADSGIPSNDFTRGQAFYDLVIETDPNNDQILYVGGIDLFRSDDGGVTWGQMSKWSNNNALATLNVPLVHADQHGFYFHPTDSNKAIIGNDGGVYYASSLLDATQDNDPNNFIDPRNKDLNTMQFYHGAISQSVNDDIIAGAQDNGTQFISNANNTSSNPGVDVYGGDGAYTFIDKDGEYMIVSYVYNVKARLNLPYTGEGIELDDDQDTGSFINPQELDDNLDILYSNANNPDDSSINIRRYKGIKSGEELEVDEINNVRLNSTITALRVSPFETSSTTLYVGLQSGDLLRVKNADSDNPTWENIEAGLFSGSISCIEFGSSEDEIMVTFHNYGVNNIWYTDNGASFWLRKDGDFPDIPTKAIMMNPLNNNQVILGTELGVWTTNNFKDFSPNWVQANNGMSNVKVTSFDLRKSDNTVLATTYGRGMFTGKFTDAVASVEDVNSDLDAFTVYPAISSGNFTVFAKSDMGESSLSVFNISGKEVYKSNVNFSENEKQSVSLTVSSGVYFVKLTDANSKVSSQKIIIE